MPENDRELEQNRLYRILPPEFKEGLSDAEKLILQKAPTGEYADCWVLKKKTCDVEKPDDWPDNHNVRAEFLEWLLRDREAIELVHDKGVRIAGIRIRRRLDLECIQIPFSLVIQHSRLENGVNLKMAKTQVIDFLDNFVKGINAERILVEGTMHLENIISNDKISLTGADIGGNLQCTGAKFINEQDVSFEVSCTTIKGATFIDKIESYGSINFIDAVIGGSFVATGAKFYCEDASAFNGDRMKVIGTLFYNEVESKGEIRFLGAIINGDVYSANSKFENKNKTALNFVQTKIDGRLWLDEIKKIKGFLDLRGTKAETLADEENSWPEKGKLILDGFEYGSFADGSPRDAKSRLKWLDLQIPVKKKPEKTEEPDKKPEKPYEYKFSPQPYEHLARLFRKMGKRADANTVLLKKERLRRKYVVKNWLEKLWGFLLDATIGYGYRVSRALIIVAAFIVVGTAIFGEANCKSGLLDLYEKKENTSSPEFNAFIYSIDTFVPFLDLHQEKYWEPYGTFATYYWIHIIMGWVFTTLLAAKFTGLIRRE